MGKTGDYEVFKRKFSVRKFRIIVIRLMMVLVLGMLLVVKAYPVMGSVKNVSPEAYVVKGKVTDVKGVPLLGVTVRLDSTFVGGVTDKDGMFSFLLTRVKRGVVLVPWDHTMPPGRHVINMRVSNEGYTRDVDSVFTVIVK